MSWVVLSNEKIRRYFRRIFSLCICFSDPINHIALVRGGDRLKSQTFLSENQEFAFGFV